MGTTVKVIVAGVILWLIALVVEIARSAPAEQIWICVVGAALGVIGLIYSIRRLKREARN
jgi:FtsH-binding integral membrane protein